MNKERQYYGCDCDKYNPDCKCYPKPVRYVEDTRSLRSLEDIEQEIKSDRPLRDVPTDDLLKELQHRYEGGEISDNAM